MDPAHKEVLRKHRLELSNHILVSDTVLPFLYQENIITESQVEEIESQKTNKNKTLRLLDVLPSRGPFAFDAFLRSLEEFSWLRDKLLHELHTAARRPEALATGKPRNRKSREKEDVFRSVNGCDLLRDFRLELQAKTKTRPDQAKDDWHIPDPVLQKVPSDRELSRLAFRLGPEWESVLLDLGLSVESLFRCRADHPLSAHQQVLAGLVQWRRSEGRNATVQRLLQSLRAADIHPSVLQDVFR